MKSLYILLLPLLAGFFSGCKESSAPVVLPEVTVFMSKPGLRIDGLGVNITPSQWNNGKLKPAIDLLVDDLGASLFRFDCTGLTNWLDPARRLPGGKWPVEYLDSVYRSKVFTDAWAVFRYLNSKGIDPFFNVSGRNHPGLGKPDAPFQLVDFDGYAEMIATMLQWAREKEKLRFSLVAPFNETDIGFPEGPRIDDKDMVLATREIIKKLDEHSLNDIRIIAIDDAAPLVERLTGVLSDTALKRRISVFATHIYGNGDIGERELWFEEKTDYARFAEEIGKSAFSNSSLWMSEYGDLDQTGLIEYEFAWRSTRRLMKTLSYGFNAAIAWDAFDNLHMHDTAWATYGLLKTDTVNWTYSPKKRYFAARQAYKFIRPGWHMVELTRAKPLKHDVYSTWHDLFRHVRIETFESPDGLDFTALIMNEIESDVAITFIINGLKPEAHIKKFYHYVTDRQANCRLMKSPAARGDTVKIILPANSISTVTTLK
jgi:hypothetical protein